MLQQKPFVRCIICTKMFYFSLFSSIYTNSGWLNTITNHTELEQTIIGKLYSKLQDTVTLPERQKYSSSVQRKYISAVVISSI